MSCDLINLRTCKEILTRYGDKDNAADIQLVRYYLTENELIIKILYRGADLKCVIDKLDFVDGNVGDDINNVQDFVNTYIQYPMPIIPILGEEEEKDNKLRLTISQE